MTGKEPSSLRERLEKDQIEYILAQFVDIHGVAKTKAVPVAHTESLIESGAGFAGFAVEGTALEPHSPDLIAMIDASSYRKLSWMPGFARCASDGYVNGAPHPLDARVICKRAMSELRAELGAEFMTGLEPEFFLLRRDESGALGPLGPDDVLPKPCYDYRAFNRSAATVRAISDALIAAGIDVYQIDHEDANGQFEINFTYSDALTTADDFTFVKMAATEVAFANGAICTFMPKPFADRSGSGMHMHLSVSDGKTNLFEDKKDARGLELSKLAYHFLAGILSHAKAIAAIACPTVNSYKRLISSGSRSGATWAPVFICYGDNNRSAMVRVPKGRLELRIPDAGCNPYLLTAAVIGAGLDGVRKQMGPGEPINENLYTLTADAVKGRGISVLPRNLLEALDAVESDEVVRSALGSELTDEFVRLKRSEWDEYHRHVSDWEIKRYLELF